MTKDKILQEVKEYGIVTLGVILIAVALEYFFMPYDIAAGGLSGFALVLNHYFPALSVAAIIFIGNIILYIIAFITIGPEFGIKTIYGSYLLSGVMWVIEKFFNPGAVTSDIMLSTIFGALLTAIGLAIVFNVNASTGGTDIIAKILNKYTSFNIGIALLMVDFLVTLGGSLTFGLDKGLYAMLDVIATGPLIDKIISLLNEEKQTIIISDKNDQFAQYIEETLQMECKFIRGGEGYTENNKNSQPTKKINKTNKPKNSLDKKENEGLLETMFNKGDGEGVIDKLFNKDNEEGLIDKLFSKENDKKKQSKSSENKQNKPVNRKEQSVLYTVLEKKQLIELKKFIMENDENAFVAISTIEEVMGKGFSQLEY